MQDVEMWRQAVRDHYGCDGVFREKVRVREEYGDRVLWEGDVGVFELGGAHRSSLAYLLTWDSRGGELRVYPLLHAGLVDSPAAAVRAVIVHEFEQRDR